MGDKRSHQSPCVTRPGPCHHKTPVVAGKYPPPPLHHPPPFLDRTAQERVRQTDRQTKQERVQTEAM